MISNLASAAAGCFRLVPVVEATHFTVGWSVGAGLRIREETRAA